MDYGQCIGSVEQPAPKRQFPLLLGKKQDEDISWGYPQDVVDAVLHASGQSALTACIPYMENQTIPTTASVASAGAR